MLRIAPTAVLVAAAAGCSASDAKTNRARAAGASPRPDEPPVMVNAELPFHYQGALYARRAQGNVTLRLFVDRDGRAMPDSTRVDEPSGYPALDTAAVIGSRDLRFIPAKLHGEPIAVSILFPVFFRHPEARPLLGDTILGHAKP
jgi:TonB family protein